MNTDKVARNSLLYILGAVVPQVLGVLTLPLYSRFLSPADYGVLALINAFSIFLPLALTLQLHSSLDRFYFEYKDGPLREFVSTLFVTVLLFSGVVLTVLWNFSDGIVSSLYPSLTESERPLFRYALATAFLNVLASFPITLIKVQEKAALFLRTSLVLLAISTVVTVLELVVLGRGCRGFVESAFISSVMGFAAFLTLARRFFGGKLDFTLLREPLRFSLPIIPHSLSTTVFMVSDRWVLEKFVPLAAIGLYAFADRIAFAFRILVIKLNEALMPQFMSNAHKDPAAAAAGMARIGEKTHFLLCLALVLVGSFCFEIVDFFFDDRYLGAWHMIPLLGSAFIFRNLYQIASAGLFYTKRTGLVAVCTLVSGGANLAVNFLLIPRFGVVVAVWSTILSYFLSYAMAQAMARRVLPIPLHTRKVAALTGLVYLHFGFVYLVQGHLGLPWSIVAKAVLLVFFLWSAHHLGFVSHLDLARFKRLGLGRAIFGGAS